MSCRKFIRKGENVDAIKTEWDKCLIFKQKEESVNYGITQGEKSHLP